MAIGTPTTLGTNTDIGNFGAILTTTAVVPSGALVIVLWSWASGGAAQTLSSVSGGGLTWAVDHNQNHAGITQQGYGIASAQAPSGLASSTAITPTFSGTLGASQVAGCYCTGLQTSAAKDVSDGNGQSVTAWDTTATSTTVSDTLVIGGAQHDGLQTNTASGGASELHDFQVAGGADLSMCVEYKVLSVSGSASLTGTWTGSAADTVSAFVAYKGVPAGPAPDTQTRRYQVRRSRMTSW